MLNRIKSKLKSNRGESLTEVLASTFVIGFATIMLGTVIQTSVHIVQNSGSRMKQNYDRQNALESNGLALLPTSGTTVENVTGGIALVGQYGTVQQMNPGTLNSSIPIKVYLIKDGDTIQNYSFGQN